MLMLDGLPFTYIKKKGSFKTHSFEIDICAKTFLIFPIGKGSDYCLIDT